MIKSLLQEGLLSEDQIIDISGLTAGQIKDLRNEIEAEQLKRKRENSDIGREAEADED